MSKHYEQRKESNERYLAKFDEIRIRLPKEYGAKEKIAAHAKSRGESVNAFILRAIEQTMRRDKRPFLLDGDNPPLVWHEIEEESSAE